MPILCTILHALRRNVLNTLTAAQRHWMYAIPPLSSKPRASRMVFKGIMCFALIVFFVSCKSVEAVTSDAHNSSLITHSSHHDTVVLRDSVFVREVMKGDTVYLTRTEYRDRWRVRLVHDTIHDTQYIERVVEHPPERYVPKFYRWCTIALWAIGLLVIGRVGYKAMRRGV